MLGLMPWRFVANATNRAPSRPERLDEGGGLRMPERAWSRSREPVLQGCASVYERQLDRRQSRDPNACPDFDVNEKLAGLNANLEEATGDGAGHTLEATQAVTVDPAATSSLPEADRTFSLK